MIGRTIGLYLARDFLTRTLSIFALFLFLIVAVDLIDFSRQAGKTVGVTFSDIAAVSAYRAPAFAENILPFCVLFGASASLILLNRRLELVVARASGVSVWQFLLPVGLSAAALGLFASLIYNPLALMGSTKSKAIEASIFGQARGSFGNKSKNFWLRLNHKSGDVIIRARVAENDGTKLTAVSAYRFTTTGDVSERLDAIDAEFVDTANGESGYMLRDVVANRPGKQINKLESVFVPVDISKSQLQAEQANADNISFWGLSHQAEIAAGSGKNALPFLTRFQSLASQPLLFTAMVLLAATVSLRFARFGLNGKAILGGVLAGFVLYVLSKLVVTFGSNGLVQPLIAAWSPAVVASLIGITVLLHQEDG